MESCQLSVAMKDSGDLKQILPPHGNKLYWKKKHLIDE